MSRLGVQDLSRLGVQDRLRGRFKAIFHDSRFARAGGATQFSWREKLVARARQESRM